MSKKIAHDGIVTAVENGKVSVQIVQTSACLNCDARKACGMSEQSEKIITIAYNGTPPQIGDQVEIEGTTTMGLHAVRIAMVYPILLIVASMTATWYITDSEVVSALVSLGILIPYYIVLYLLRDKMEKEFAFTLKKST